MRLAAYLLEEQEAMLVACAAHQPGLAEWMEAAQSTGMIISEGVSFGDCPVNDGEEHVEYTEGAETDPKL